MSPRRLSFPRSGRPRKEKGEPVSLEHDNAGDLAINCSMQADPFSRRRSPLASARRGLSSRPGLLLAEACRSTSTAASNTFPWHPRPSQVGMPGDGFG